MVEKSNPTEDKIVNNETITEQTVIEKVQKNEKLNEKESEIFKGIPSGALPNPTPEGKEEKKETNKGTQEEVKKPEEKTPAENSSSEEIPEDRKKLIQAEIEKPEHLADLSKLKSPVEIGLYWDLRKARRKNQKLEEELEISRVANVVKDLKSKEEISTEEDDPLKDKEDEDLLTVADIKKIFAKSKSKPKPQEKPAQPLRTPTELRVEKIEANSILMSKGIEDFNDVIDFAESALKDDKEAIDILRDTAKSGGNVAEKTYWLIKGSPVWPKIEKIISDEKAKSNGKKEPDKKALPKENLDRIKKMEENDGKIKTTGASDGASAETGEYTVEEIRNMTISDIKRLPKKTRMMILEKYGSEPNYSR